MLFMTIAEYYNITYDVLNNNGVWGAQPVNNTWSGVTGMLQSKESYPDSLTLLPILEVLRTLPHDTRIDPKKTDYQDGDEVTYSCPYDKLYSKTQTMRCMSGVWVGTRSTCGYYIKNQLI
ncbi:unnamed protein product, partial [Oppiella nova]